MYVLFLCIHGCACSFRSSRCVCVSDTGHMFDHHLANANAYSYHNNAFKVHVILGEKVSAKLISSRDGPEKSAETMHEMKTRKKSALLWNNGGKGQEDYPTLDVYAVYVG